MDNLISFTCLFSWTNSTPPYPQKVDRDNFVYLENYDSNLLYNLLDMFTLDDNLTYEALILQR